MGVTYNLPRSNIYLDANIFIYLLEGYAEFVPALTQIFSLIDNGNLQGITSELTLAETLVKPMINKNLALQDAYKNIIQTSTALHVAPITRDILIQAAQLRANVSNISALRLPDAIHVATAHANSCQLFLTNDKKLQTAPNIKTILLSEIKNSTITADNTNIS